ncbi:hypothetical protein OUZ56_028728 [Daphnia magna]|uniref:Uncharacterized protein n=1 Tax=Daphnia magna TaxID=35525 RepID=A0ABR0B4R1_9CRUS|nr:hypothetical protein OUZ56_028728 [Daphnia magna]
MLIPRIKLIKERKCGEKFFFIIPDLSHKNIGVIIQVRSAILTQQRRSSEIKRTTEHCRTHYIALLISMTVSSHVTLGVLESKV